MTARVEQGGLAANQLLLAVTEDLRSGLVAGQDGHVRADGQDAITDAVECRCIELESLFLVVLLSVVHPGANHFAGMPSLSLISRSESRIQRMLPCLS